MRAPFLFLAIAAGSLLLLALPAQAPEAAPAPDAIETLRREIQAAEHRLRTIEVELQTTGLFGNGDEFQTVGSLRLQRQPERRLRTAVTFRTAGITGLMEAAQGPDGILLYQDDPAFGEVLVRIPPAIVGDLEWAGEVLKRADLPGMKDARADSPLGSGVLAELRREFVLAIGERKERQGEAGIWIVGDRRPGLPEQDAELPMASRIELFVRQRDLAVLEVSHYQGEKLLQRVEVKRLQVDAALAEAAFRIDPRGQKVREVNSYPPLWESIQRAIERAESRAGEGVVRPSRR